MVVPTHACRRRREALGLRTRTGVYGIREFVNIKTVSIKTAAAKKTADAK
jgi:hypothetical protein